MDYLLLILSGVAIGLIVAAPIGPVNLICIRRTLAFGPLNGFFAGVGAAAGDGTFAIVTAFGLTAIAQLIQGFSIYLQLGGGIMLIAFGVHTFLFHPDKRAQDQMNAAEKGASLVRAMLSTFALTITNPATLIGFAALFAGVGGLITAQPTFGQAAFLVVGVIAGSALWWLVITTGVGIFHKSITARAMAAINHGSGVVIALFGLVVLGRLAFAQLG